MQSFLALHPPFNQLTTKQLSDATNNIYVAFAKSGSTLNTSAPETSDIKMTIVRSGSLEIRTAENNLIDRLGAGDYLLINQLTNQPPANIIVLEDCLYYQLTQFAFDRLIAENTAFARLCKVANKIEEPTATIATDKADSPLDELAENAYLTQKIKGVMSFNLICVDVKTSIREAAKKMKQQSVSSLLIEENSNIVGIITDRDFTTAVLAEGICEHESIQCVITHSPICIDLNQSLFDAQLLMMAKGLHHLLITKNDKPVGIITPSDILRANNIEPIALVRAINRAASPKQIKISSDKIPALVVRLIEHDTRPIDLGKIITTLADTITKRLLSLAEEELGKTPCDYAWLAFGSQARQEQVLGSDQDNGLLLADNFQPQDAPYFKKLAQFVNDGLNLCGIPYCPGEIMASNTKWRMTLTDWKHCFANWIEQPTPKALMHSSIFFDMRHIAGEKILTKKLHLAVRQRAQNNTIFLAMLIENALQNSPPLGFFKTFVLENDGNHNKILNLKKRGTIPIVDIARYYALTVCVKSLNTIERLQAIVEKKAMSKEMAYSLIDAHEFIAGIRLEAQAKQYGLGEKTNNNLNPTALSPLVRHQLKDAFSLVTEAQNAMKVNGGGRVL